jgi:hypothetical protein
MLRPCSQRAVGDLFKQIRQLAKLASQCEGLPSDDEDEFEDDDDNVEGAAP